MRIIAFSLLLAACSGGDKDTGGLVGDPEAGATVYSTNCAGCHGADGEGGTGPAMSEVAAESDADIEETVLNGSDDGSMPAFPDLTEQEIADLLAYIRETY